MATSLVKYLKIQINEQQRVFIQNYQPLFIASTLVRTLYEQIFLVNCLGKKFSTELLYRASKDGYTAAAFHEKCDKKGPNISFIKSEHGLVFGGYTSLSWDSVGGYAIDYSNPFIFSLTNKTKHLNHTAQNSRSN